VEAIDRLDRRQSVLDIDAEGAQEPRLGHVVPGVVVDPEDASVTQQRGKARAQHGEGAQLA
jgi:hypothetical protein